jgi:short-subunit dehydrogenase
MNSYGVRVSIINPVFINTAITKKNNFKMSLVMDPDKAANIIFNNVTNKDNFEIIFPKIFVNFLKILRILPYKIYFFLMMKKIIYKIFYKK